MSDGSAIEWTDATWNPVRGCTKVSPGCKHCYAETLAERFRGVPGHPFEHGFDLQLIPAALELPLRWRAGRRIFVNSMSDLFHEALPFEEVDKVVAVMTIASHHTFQVLTKRPERMAEYLASRGPGGDRHLIGKYACEYAPKLVDDHGGIWVKWPLPNVWWGFSAEDQATFDRRWAAARECRPHAAVLWVSLEPLLGPVDLKTAQPFLAKLGAVPVECPHGYDACPQCDAGIDWVVVGGESGAGARPMDPDWVRQLRRQCHAAGVPFHFKQWGEWLGAYGAWLFNVPDPSLFPQPETVTRHHVAWWQDGLETVNGRMAHQGPDHWWHPVVGVEHGGRWSTRVGKRKAGRLLDGRTWDEYPKGYERPAEPARRTVR